MRKFYILLTLPAFLLLSCGSYEEFNSFMAAKCGDNYYDIEKQFCQNSQIYDKCGGYNYDPLNQKCENDKIFPRCGNDYYDFDKQFCQNREIYDRCDGYSYDPLNQKCENNILFSKCGDKWYDSFSEICTGEFTDIRDGRIYKYVAIGTQVWMAENLRYETSNTKCYDDNLDNCETYGMLYDWNTAKTICPSGWHLPNDTEWFTLREIAPNEKLMANSVLWESGKGTDDFGFAALPGGFYRGGYFSIKEQAHFWSATAGSISGSAHAHTITLQSGIKDINGFYTNNSLINVRCIKD